MYLEVPDNDLALNPTGAGYPKIIDNDPGWGCCPYTYTMIDGKVSTDIAHDASEYGFAFTGGSSVCGGPWQGSCGDRTFTLDFGTAKSFNNIVVYHTRDYEIPRVLKMYVATEMGHWNNFFSTTDGRSSKYTNVNTMKGTWNNNVWSLSFETLTARYIKYVFNNCDICHGWIAEFEVFNKVTSPPVDPCTTKTYCKDNAVCTSGNVVCKSGWKGTDCCTADTPVINDCPSLGQYCKDNAVCNSGTVVCKTGWKGTDCCTADAPISSDCPTLSKYCAEGAICQSGKVICKTGYYGENCCSTGLSPVISHVLLGERVMTIAKINYTESATISIKYLNLTLTNGTPKNDWNYTMKSYANAVEWTFTTIVGYEFCKENYASVLESNFVEKYPVRSIIYVNSEPEKAFTISYRFSMTTVNNVTTFIPLDFLPPPVVFFNSTIRQCQTSYCTAFNSVPVVLIGSSYTFMVSHIDIPTRYLTFYKAELIANETVTQINPSVTNMNGDYAITYLMPPFTGPKVKLRVQSLVGGLRSKRMLEENLLNFTYELFEEASESESNNTNAELDLEIVRLNNLGKGYYPGFVAVFTLLMVILL